ncbi:toll-like receptor 18 [Larimichthys crocea]|uniref:toll-like receptor 18 n=1 Tax=Larimichthys crocea TaxID=215358 RepID=UPI000F5E21B5|nr:toll-like receptor 2 type-2 [Larimichthys crocea]XP_019115298.2 toll-like receptor 2 type-2 [Larimichthys crocea]XP_027142523.1 toll-like receptor 2 type-2 [Larimichthys crocea]WOL43247.1 toll-like receptor 14 [Larimichthys crocea]
MIWKLVHFSALLLGALTSPTPSSAPNNTDEGPCLIDNSGHTADCLGKQLESVPWRQFPSTLEEIDLSYNKLQAIHADDFLHLPQLHILKLQFNNISYIDNDAFKNNRLLEHLNIFNNSLQEIPATALIPLVNLKELYMSNNLYKHATLADSFSKFVKLQVLSMGGPLVMGLKKADFQPLKNTRLQGFAIKCSSNLSYYEPGSLEAIQTNQMGFDMAIDQLPNALLHMLRDLANKTFGVIQFRNLFEFTYYTGEEDIFQGLQDVTAGQVIFHRGKFNENLLRMALMNLQIAPIKRLRLQYIDFARSATFVDSGAGSSITDLALDNLDLWYISNPDVLRFDWRFTWLNKIKKLSIQYVYFNSVPCDSWIEMVGVQLLDVSNNRLENEYIFNQRCQYKGAMPNLHTFNMNNNDLTSLKDVSSLTREFQQLQVLDVSNNKLGSAKNSRDCVWQKNINRFIAHHNQFESEALRCLPTTVHYLDLSYCELDQLDMTYFEKATSLKELLLSGNKIKFIPSKWKSPSMQSLALDGNSFGLISKESFQDMPQLSRLRAGNNPYHCTCELHAFVEDTVSKGKVNLTDWPWNFRCYHPEAFLNTFISKYLPSRVACDIRLVIIISVATTAAVILILMMICYIFDLPWYTKATYQIIRAKYRAHKEKLAGEVGTFTYHAFISYSHSDADWVRDQLLPCLENNRNPYRLCIHERDFMPGRWIIDNIIDNIENSRKVIFVLSRHFVNSEWCNYELYFAQQRAMGKTFSDVILVVKEPIDPSSLPSKYCKLKKMLSTKTYLEWPQQVNQQAFFWSQLKSVLGKPTMTREGAHSIKSRTSSVGAISVIAPPVEDRPEIAAPNADREEEPNIEIIKEDNDEQLNQRQIPLAAF